MSEEDKKRMWIKYYCEECRAWETRELLQAKLREEEAAAASSSSLFSFSPPASALWSWGCGKLIHHGAFQAFRVAELDVDAEATTDAAGSLKLDFPSIDESPATTQPPPTLLEQKREVPEEGSAPHIVNVSLSNGSSQSKRPKRNVRSTYLRDSVAEATSPINSQGAVTSSSPDEVENGVSNVHLENGSKDGEAAAADTTGPGSPAVIDIEHPENGVYKRPRRLTAGDRGLAQALQYEKPARLATKPLSEIHNVSPKQKTNDLNGVRTRSTAKKTSKKNRKIGDLY